MSKERKYTNKKKWFRVLLHFLRIFFRKRKFIFEGEIPGKDCIIVSNHAAASGPVFFELYAPFINRFWGTYEMTGGVKASYRYLSTNYLPKKKHFPKWLSKVFAFIICPFTNLFYKGLELIPTYTDIRFMKTINKTIDCLKSGETVLIFPEDSHDGYHQTLTHFYPGAFYAAKVYFEKENDVKVFPCYYIKKLRTFVVGKGILFSELYNKYGKDYQKMADEFCDICNDLNVKYLQKK